MRRLRRPWCLAFGHGPMVYVFWKRGWAGERVTCARCDAVIQTETER